MAEPIIIAGFAAGGVPLLCVQMGDGDRAKAEQYYAEGRRMVWMTMCKVPVYRVVVRLKPGVTLPAPTMIHEMPDKMQ